MTWQQHRQLALLAMTFFWEARAQPLEQLPEETDRLAPNLRAPSSSRLVSRSCGGA